MLLRPSETCLSFRPGVVSYRLSVFRRNPTLYRRPIDHYRILDVRRLERDGRLPLFSRPIVPHSSVHSARLRIVSLQPLVHLLPAFRVTRLIYSRLVCAIRLFSTKSKLAV